MAYKCKPFFIDVITSQRNSPGTVVYVHTLTTGTGLRNEKVISKNQIKKTILLFLIITLIVYDICGITP